jgi:hypothetical protein
MQCDDICIRVNITYFSCYFQVLRKQILDYSKIKELTYRNYTFLKNQKLNQKDKVKQEIIPVISKSLTLLSYIAFCSDEGTLKILFDFLLEDIDEDLCFNFISDSIFSTFKNFCINHPTNIIKFKAFEALGYYWIKFPHKLPYSKDIIEEIFKSLNTQGEKLMVLKTFNYIFSSQYKSFQAGEAKNFDFGTVHLFFEGFMTDILCFLINESNMLIRYQSITLIKTIMELGNINSYTLLPYVFSSLFDYNTEIRFNAVYILEKIIKISKEKFLANIKECLKLSFQLNKNIYVEPKYFNSQVKDLNDGADISFTIKSENIFELFKYKIGKSIKDETFNKKILIKFIQTFQDINTLDNVFMQNTNEGFKKFEFFEYVGTLIADYKFNHNHEIAAVFTSLYKDFSTGYLVFLTKLKEFKQNYSDECLTRLILLFLTSALKLSIFKFLTTKYDDIENLQNSLKRNLDNDCLNENKVSISKDLRNFRFYEFYSAFSFHYKKIFKLSVSGQKNNINLIKAFKKLKEFEKLKTSDIREIVSKYKKKVNKLNEENLQQFLYSHLIPEKEKEEPPFTDKIVNKNRKRITLEENEKFNTSKKEKRKKK